MIFPTVLNKGVKMKKNLMIIFGGKSVEHDISIITAIGVAKLVSNDYNLIPVYITRQGEWITASNLLDISLYSNFEKLAKKARTVKVIFSKRAIAIGKKVVEIYSCINCCHGGLGENGGLAAVLEFAQIPHTSSSSSSSLLAMDKELTKLVLNHNLVTNCDYFVFKKNMNSETLKKQKEKIKYPVIVKPSSLGSSVGIDVCHNSMQLENAFNVAFSFDEKIIVEDFLENCREFNCAGFRFENKIITSNVCEVHKDEIFSFDDKYIGRIEEGVEKKIAKRLQKELKKLTQEIYEMFECFGVVRVDFLFKDGKVYVNEINSIPGSLAFYLFEEDFSEILDIVLQESVKRMEEKSKLISIFHSDALAIFENLSESEKLKK